VNRRAWVQSQPRYGISSSIYFENFTTIIVVAYCWSKGTFQSYASSTNKHFYYYLLSFIEHLTHPLANNTMRSLRYLYNGGRVHHQICQELLSRGVIVIRRQLVVQGMILGHQGFDLTYFRTDVLKI
jgi:hypothetical protein